MLTPTCRDPGLGVPIPFPARTLRPSVLTGHIQAPGLGTGAGSPLPSLPARVTPRVGAEELPLRVLSLKANPIVGAAVPGGAEPAWDGAGAADPAALD